MITRERFLKSLLATAATMVTGIGSTTAQEAIKKEHSIYALDINTQFDRQIVEKKSIHDLINALADALNHVSAVRDSGMPSGHFGDSSVEYIFDIPKAFEANQKTTEDLNVYTYDEVKLQNKTERVVFAFDKVMGFFSINYFYFNSDKKQYINLFNITISHADDKNFEVFDFNLGTNDRGIYDADLVTADYKKIFQDTLKLFGLENDDLNLSQGSSNVTTLVKQTKIHEPKFAKKVLQVFTVLLEKLGVKV